MNRCHKMSGFKVHIQITEITVDPEDGWVRDLWPADTCIRKCLVLGSYMVDLIEDWT